MELTSRNARVVVDLARGGRISTFEVEGHGLLVPQDENPLAWGSYPMAPWAGRVRNGVFVWKEQEYRLPLSLPPHAIHGTTFARPWERTGPNRIEIELGDDWPWPGVAIQEFSLRDDVLALHLEVRATTQSFPATLGWHP